MKYTSIKICLVIIALFGGVAGASELTDCPSDKNALWHNCLGTFTLSDDGIYVGEWRDDNMNGQGTFTWSDGSKYVGAYKNDKFNGQGTYTTPGGTIEEGIFKDSVYLGTVAEAERAEKTHSVYQLVNRRCDP